MEHHIKANAQDHWNQLANEAEERSEYERSIGIDLSPKGQSPGDNRGRLYRKVALSFALKEQTGKEYCMCHMVPVGECPHALDTAPFITLG